jgi:hypothetical protein
VGKIGNYGREESLIMAGVFINTLKLKGKQGGGRGGAVSYHDQGEANKAVILCCHFRDIDGPHC